MPSPRLQGLKLVTPPAEEPVSVAEAKAFMRISDLSEDALIGSIITAIRLKAEAYTKRAFVTQSWKLTFDAAPVDFILPVWPSFISVPRPPLQAVDSIKYFEEDDTEQTFALASVNEDLNSEPGRVYLKQGESWPSGLRALDSFHVNFTAGYGDASDVPEDIKEAILSSVASFFEHREELGDEIVPRLTPVSASLLHHKRIFYLA